MSNDLNLNINQNYDIPEDRDGFVNENTGEIVEKKDLSPFDVIKKIAEEMGQNINDPNPKCKKCYGRGFIGRDHKTKAPVPCYCIYPKKTEGEKNLDYGLGSKLVGFSRKQRRLMERKQKRLLKKKRKEIKNKNGDVNE